MFFTGKDKQVYFKEPFQDKYTLTVISDVLAGSIPIKTTTEIRWDFKVTNVTEEGAFVELLTLEHELIDSNNPNLHELARMTQAFGRMYNELSLFINQQGQVIEVLNLEMIRKKWLATKAELQRLDQESEVIKGIIVLNDELFTTPEKINQAITQNEFFTLYFNQIYGKKLPYTSKVKKWNHFQQAEVEWFFTIQPVSSLLPAANEAIIEITGDAVTKFNKEWMTKAYQSFPNIDISVLQPRMIETGNYTLNPKNGKLLKAVLLKEEVAHPQLLFSKIEYVLEADSAAANKEKKQQEQNTTSTVLLN